MISTTSGTGGAERLLLNLLEAGDDRGWEQLVLNPFAAEVPSAFAQLSDTTRYRRHPCDGPLGLVSLRRWIQRELCTFEPAITHAMLFHATVAVATLPRRCSGQRLLTHVYGEGLPAKGPANVHSRLDCIAGRRFDRLVAISQSVQDYLSRECGLAADKVAIIPPGWDGEPVPPVTEDRPPTIICVAGLRPEKGHAFLLTAFGHVLRQVPDAQLVLVGDGETRPHLEAQVEAEQLQGHVQFAGVVPEIWPHLARADLFALASASEAFGMAIVEAMAAGLPVVAPRVGGIPELVAPGVCGELYTPGDTVGFAEHMVTLLRSPETRARMAMEARDVAESLRMQNTLPLYFDIYDELLDAPGSRARR